MQALRRGHATVVHGRQMTDQSDALSLQGLSVLQGKRLDTGLKSLFAWGFCGHSGKSGADAPAIQVSNPHFRTYDSPNR
jgi:hypothetical protein